jgi:uncharacterized membrane protein
MHKTPSLHKHHLEALIDGVFAIAMTILVLEVKVPDLAEPSSAAELMHALGHHLYVIVAYFLSFALLGLFWMWHHRLSNQIREINGPLAMCSLAFLALVCFFPFAAALFGRYMFRGNVFVLVVYLPVVGLILGTQALYFWLAMRGKLLDPAIGRAQMMATHRWNVLWCGVFALSCIPASLILGVGAAGAMLVLAAALFWAAFKAR